MTQEDLQRLLRVKREREAGAEQARRNTPLGAPFPPSPPFLPRLEAYLRAQQLGPGSAAKPATPVASPPPPPRPRPPPPRPSPPLPSPPPPPAPSLDLQPRGLVLAPPQGVQGQVAAASLPGTQQALPDGVPVAPGQPQAQQQGQDGAGQQQA